MTLVAGPNAFAQKRIALTFDDVPRPRGAFFTPDERTARIIAGLKEARVAQAAFFVTPGFLSLPDGAGGEARIAAYAAAGHVIANHSFSHQALKSLSADAYLADIDQAALWLKDRPNLRPWFRFPFLDEGGDDIAKHRAVMAGLQARGLSNGYVTADASDWNTENLTIAANAAKKSMDMKALRRLYVRAHVESAEFADALARRALHRSPVQVMLMHETDLAALFLPDLVRGLRKRGWTIVSADEAYADPLARTEPDVPSFDGSRIELIASQMDLRPPLWSRWNDLKYASAMFAKKVLKEAPAR